MESFGSKEIIDDVKDPFEGLTQEEIIKDQQNWLKKYIKSDQYKELISRELGLQKFLNKNTLKTEESIGEFDYNGKSYDIKANIFSSSGYIEIDGVKYDLFRGGLNSFSLLRSFSQNIGINILGDYEHNNTEFKDFIKKDKESQIKEMEDFFLERYGYFGSAFFTRFKKSFAYKSFFDILDGKGTNYKIDGRQSNDIHSTELYIGLTIGNCNKKRDEEINKILEKKVKNKNITNQIINNRLNLLENAISNTHNVKLLSTDKMGASYVTINPLPKEYEIFGVDSLEKESIYKEAEKIGNYKGHVFLGVGEYSSLFGPIEEYIHSSTDSMFYGIDTTKSFMGKIASEGKEFQTDDAITYFFSTMEIHAKVGKLKYILEKFGIWNVEDNRDINLQDIQELKKNISELPKESRTRINIESVLDDIGIVLGKKYREDIESSSFLRLMNGFALNDTNNKNTKT